jgi:hypothetical protein
VGSPAKASPQGIFHLWHNSGTGPSYSNQPGLDQPFVPGWFLRYVLYHEMLHSVVPDKVLSQGRRRVHTEEFNRRERQFPGYRRARRWEEENLSRFLR